MPQLLLVSIAVLLFLFNITAIAEEQQALSGETFRTVLYQQDVSPPLEEILQRLTDPQQKPISYEELSPDTTFYLRISPRQHILDQQNQVLDSAILGTKPFIFITTPEGIYGKDLMTAYLDIGYETEDVLHWQNDVDMVAIVFRYDDAVRVSSVRDGSLSDNWQQQILIPTWENTFALFEKLATEAEIDSEKRASFMPERLFFQTEAERQFVLSYPAIGKQRIKWAGYNVLKSTAGSDWFYRELLEKKLSIFEHFRGTGRTLNEIVDPEGTKFQTGLFEFVAPNRKVLELAEFAVVHLGRLQVKERY